MCAKFGENVCRALPEFYAFTGCDSVSALSGKGKSEAFGVLTRSLKFSEGLSRLGETFEERDEDDEGFDIACLNLRTIKWFAQLYRTISSKNIELDTTPSVEYLLQTTDSSIACGIEFKNLTKFILRKPSCKVVNGLIPNPPKSMSSWGNSFMMAHKTPRSINGTSGVVSWEIENKDIRVAVMWSIPSPFWINKNTLAVCFLKEVDEHVFDSMYNCTWNNGQYISRAEYSSDCSCISCIEENLEIIGIMGNSKKTVICIELKENERQ
ncbi:Hypothetical predicted protein [Mytilus galloprovincialis]|uniref:Uncharacterized protein n=1 Tax=Mytilus galloprovincialis TaxID=29158 RepID=A0A8B6FJI7_MYTGA|nr:Hypothetical predicted protein [Mytilus galloprovincialis]